MFAKLNRSPMVLRSLPVVIALGVAAPSALAMQQAGFQFVASTAQPEVRAQVLPRPQVGAGIGLVRQQLVERARDDLNRSLQQALASKIESNQRALLDR